MDDKLFGIDISKSADVPDDDEQVAASHTKQRRGKIAVNSADKQAESDSPDYGEFDDAESIENTEESVATSVPVREGIELKNPSIDDDFSFRSRKYGL
jgi:hypothetical protein